MSELERVGLPRTYKDIISTSAYHIPILGIVICSLQFVLNVRFKIREETSNIARLEN